MLPELREALINQLPLQSFRDIADGDYIAARMAFRAELYLQALWSSQQALEKYLKAILLLRRIPWKEHRHSLSKPLLHLEAQFPLQLSPETRILSGSSMTGTQTDSAVWEVRRYCIPRDRRTTPKGTPIEVLDLKHIEDSDNHPPQGYQSPARGFLDDALGNRKHRARPALVWNNPYFGASRRNALRYVKQTFYSANSPLACSPELLDAVAEYIVLPKNLTATPRQAF